MQEIIFHIEGDTVIKETHLPEVDGFTYQAEPVIDKDTFIECYKRWILKEGEMSEKERRSIMLLADTIQGEINRMCVTKALTEFDTMYGHAKRNLDKLAGMIYDARFVPGSEEKK